MHRHSHDERSGSGRWLSNSDDSRLDFIDRRSQCDGTNEANEMKFGNINRNYSRYYIRTSSNSREPRHEANWVQSFVLWLILLRAVLRCLLHQIGLVVSPFDGM